VVQERLRRLGERWPWFGVALDVHERFSELNGGYIAGAITLSAFLAIFPLLLVTIAVVGFFQAGGSDIAARVIREFGLSGNGADAITKAIATAQESRRAASIVGLAGLLWSGLGLVAVLQYAINTVWQVKGRGIKDKAVGLAWLVGAGLIFAASFAVTGAMNVLPGFLWPVSVLAGIAISFALFLWTFFTLGNRSVGWRPLMPGALTAAIGFEVLKIVGSIYVPHAVKSSSALYGSIGVVFAVLAWLFFFGRLIVYSSVLNVVRFEAHRGTVSVHIEAPRLDGEVALEANRSGVVTERAVS
jgi:membrane protein